MQNYDYSRLHSSLVGVIQEAQAKIGYDRHAITFYYPASSVAHMLGTKEDADAVEQALAGFSAFAQPTLGAVEVVRDDERFCIYVPAEGAEYVHEKVPDSGFLKAFLAVVSGLEVSLDDILAVFHRFSDEVVCEKSRAAMSSTTSFTSKTASRTATATASSSKRTAVRPTTASFARITKRSASDTEKRWSKRRSFSVSRRRLCCLSCSALSGADSAHGSRHASCAMPIRRVRCFPRTSGRRTGR